MSTDRLQEIIGQAMQDPDLAQRLKSDPAGTLKELGVELSDDDRASLMQALQISGEPEKERTQHMF